MCLLQIQTPPPAEDFNAAVESEMTAKKVVVVETQASVVAAATAATALDKRALQPKQHQSKVSSVVVKKGEFFGNFCGSRLNGRLFQILEILMKKIRL